MSYDVNGIRQDFPILHQEINGHPLVYLDNAATTQKPNAVIDSVDQFYRQNNSNVHRGVHTLSQRATVDYEAARGRTRQFINAKKSEEIIFVRGTTEGVNLLASCFAQNQLEKDDEIIISAMEHHANIVPWQQLKERLGIKLVVISMFENGELDLEAYQNSFSDRTKLVAVTHISNAIGTINPIKAMITTAHAHNVPVLVDAAQSVVHQSVDVQELDCDFMTFSGHKMYGPTGIGVFYGKEAWLERLPPYQTGGSMIRSVSFDHTTFAELPMKFEAGTPNIAGAIGLAKAMDYLANIGIENISAYEESLRQYAEQALSAIPGLDIIGQAPHKAPVISFVLKDIHPHDIGSIVDSHGVAIRAGHHCAMPLMHFYQVPATVRASIGLYNTKEEIDALVNAIIHTQELFAR